MLEPQPTSPRRPPGVPVSMGQLGMYVLFVSLSVLFIAASIAVIITRRQVAVWRLPGQAELPWGTAASSVLLAAVSWNLQAALRAVQSNRFTLCLQRWRWAMLLAAAFLLAQALNARHLLNIEGERAAQSLFVFCYDLLVGLHAVHVLGGFVPLALVHSRIARHDYSSSRHSGLMYCVQYWHYLGVVWLILLGTLAWIS